MEYLRGGQGVLYVPRQQRPKEVVIEVASKLCCRLGMLVQFEQA